MKKLHYSLCGMAAVVMLLALSLYQATAQSANSEGAPVASMESQTPPQRILVNLKQYTNDLHATFMALKIANGLRDHGAEVTIFLNLEAVRLVDSRTPNDLQWGASDMTVGALLQKFIDGGGTVLVCPHCAEAAGIAPADLRPGAVIGGHDASVEAFLWADKVVDY